MGVMKTLTMIRMCDCGHPMKRHDLDGLGDCNHVNTKGKWCGCTGVSVERSERRYNNPKRKLWSDLTNVIDLSTYYD